MTTQPAYRYTATKTAQKDISVPMPELGEGATLRLQMADMQALQTTFGDTWLSAAHIRCDACDVPFIAALIERAGRLDGERAPIDIEQHPDIPLATFAQRGLDALYKAVYGQTFEQFLRQRIQAIAAAAETADGDPAQAATK